MAEKNVTIMVLNMVDLQSPSCYKKVKKLLYNIPEIRNQIFDERQNTVTITVECSSPEKIRDKLFSKRAKIIKCIQILYTPKPQPPLQKPNGEPEKPKPHLIAAAPLHSPARGLVPVNSLEPPPPNTSEPPSLKRVLEHPSHQSAEGPGSRAVDRRLNLTKITMIFCLGVAGEMAVQNRTENPWSFHSLCLLLMLAFSAVFVATTIEHDKAARVLESIATLFGITGFFLATTVALPLALKLVGWLIYALILLFACTCGSLKPFLVGMLRSYLA